MRFRWVAAKVNAAAAVPSIASEKNDDPDDKLQKLSLDFKNVCQVTLDYMGASGRLFKLHADEDNYHTASGAAASAMVKVSRFMGFTIWLGWSGVW